MIKPSLSVKGVTVVLGGRVVLEDVHIDFEGPGLVQVLGPNGAGKTTLFKTILGIVKPLKGRVEVCGVDVTGSPEAAGKLVGYVPQLIPQERHFPVTPLELVVFTVMARVKLPAGEARRRAEELLKAVNLPESCWGKPFWELSGGQRQRVLVACALSFDAPVLLLDEPLSAVDPVGRVELAQLLKELSTRKLVVVATHDPVLLLDATKMVVLLNRRIYGCGPPEEVLKFSVLEKVYGGAAVPLEEHVHISDSHFPTRK